MERGPPPDVSASGGLSDATILLISLSGFTFVGLLFYILVLRGFQHEGDDKDNARRAAPDGAALDYDDDLDGSDVGTLNRAQRRARAKNRMKRNRRAAREVGAAAEVNNGGGGDGVDGGVAVAARGEDGNGNVEGEGGVGGAVAQIRPMTRKERQKAAKAAEREERRRYEEQRREELRLKREAEEIAFHERKEREREEAEDEEEERIRLERKREERERAEYEEWKTMFAVNEAGEDGGGSERNISVSEFIDYIKLHKVVVVDDIATEFCVSSKTVVERLRQLEQAGRITGIIDDRGKFVYITPDEMKAVADFIREKGRVNLTELAEESSRLINLNEESVNEDEEMTIVFDEGD